MPAPATIDIDDWDALMQAAAKVVYVQARADEKLGKPLTGLTIQEIGKKLPKKDTGRIKNRLQELHLSNLLQIREDMGQKRYAFDLFQIKQYGHRDDIAEMVEFLEG
jgi:hypothetical protein